MRQISVRFWLYDTLHLKVWLMATLELKDPATNITQWLPFYFTLSDMWVTYCFTKCKLFVWKIWPGQIGDNIEGESAENWPLFFEHSSNYTQTISPILDLSPKLSRQFSDMNMSSIAMERVFSIDVLMGSLISCPISNSTIKLIYISELWMLCDGAILGLKAFPWTDTPTTHKITHHPSLWKPLKIN